MSIVAMEVKPVLNSIGMIRERSPRSLSFRTDSNLSMDSALLITLEEWIFLILKMFLKTLGLKVIFIFNSPEMLKLNYSHWSHSPKAVFEYNEEQ